ncbi:hypothetical protein MICAH_2650004 [Microcystis aeruginosa PCC 9809]|uniref:Uncharacterized protein n=1 Tax=Microcystis aeruginosa PCC 9809 TaxID=1160285 RepID=I4HPG1_MICAE|nr:hypothetical protein MICAH_2650004 [Microcystis aeruginosa PCC 9809]
MGNTEFGLCLTLSFISYQLSVISYQYSPSQYSGDRRLL